MKQNLGLRPVLRRITSFVLDGVSRPVRYVETTHPNDNVECDAYMFEHMGGCDLAIIAVKAHGATPLQKVLKGDKAIRR